MGEIAKGMFCWIFVALILVMVLPVKSQLAVGFYSKTCPKAESIVRSTVEFYYKADPTIAASLVRLHFHDCFVQGCDASVLIGSAEAEINAGPNMGLRGFEVVDDAKAQLENLCPGVVSCADILALANRDAIDLSDGPSWSVPTGRRDGMVSISSEAEDLPSPFEPIEVHIQKFAEKGLDVEDLVTLVGAHTIGRTDCQLFSYRLENFTSTGNPDPTINPSFLTELRTLCPLDGDPFRGVAMDKDSQMKFDNSFFKNLRNGNGVLESDQRLWTHPSTRDIVQNYAGNLRGLLGLRFNYAFKKAIVKLSTIGVKTGTQGQIRKGCDGSVLNGGPFAERNALGNLGLRGFEVIEDAKAQLEAECPGVVSCADILALAARDAVHRSEGPSWSVPTGRRDGRVSSKSQAENLPSPLESIAVHKKKFAEKGLDEEDLVTLVRAHTIGQTDCQFFRYRLQNFTATGNSDPTINPTFLAELKVVCPKDGDARKRVALDKESQLKFDASFFKNIRDGNGVLESDQRLWNDDSTKAIVHNYASPIRGLSGLRFDYNFKRSMIKMSSIEVKTGTQGEIRRRCSRFN